MAEEEKKEVQEQKSEVIPGTDVAPQKPVESPPPEQPAATGPAPAPGQINIDVDAQTAVAIKVQEFDKLIAEAEENVASLKKQRAAYIYETNVQNLIKQAQQKQNTPTP